MNDGAKRYHRVTLVPEKQIEVSTIPGETICFGYRATAQAMEYHFTDDPVVLDQLHEEIVEEVRSGEMILGSGEHDGEFVPWGPVPGRKSGRRNGRWINGREEYVDTEQASGGGTAPAPAPH